MDEAGSFPRANQMNARRRPKALFILIAFLLILSVLIFLGTRFLGTGTEDVEEEQPTPVIEPSATPEPTDSEDEPTPTAAEDSDDEDLDKADASVQILNGSGISGAASSMSAILKSAGWSDISTGNADSFEFEDVSISVTSEASGLLSMLEEDLSDDYTIGDTDTDLSSDTYDAVITIGK